MNTKVGRPLILMWDNASGLVNNRHRFMEGLSNFVSISFDVRRLLASGTSDPDAVDYTCRESAMADIPGTDCPTMTRDKSTLSTPSPGPTEGHGNTVVPPVPGKNIRFGAVQFLVQCAC